MTQAAVHLELCDPQPSTRQWRNALPEWIVQSAEYESLSPGFRWTLQAIADRCDAPNAEGHLMTCWGGKSLHKASGCARTFYRHASRLESMGFIVCVGTMKATRGRWSYNLWAVPGSQGGLDDCRRRRTDRRMVHTGGGVYRPADADPQEQLPLFEGVSAETDSHLDPETVTPPCDKVSRHRVTECHTVPVTECHTTTPSDHPLDQRQDHVVDGYAIDGVGVEVQRQIAGNIMWLKRAQWRSDLNARDPVRWLDLLMTDVERMFRACDAYREKAQEIRRTGGQVRDPAALFDACWTGKIKGAFA